MDLIPASYEIEEEKKESKLLNGEIGINEESDSEIE